MNSLNFVYLGMSLSLLHLWRTLPDIVFMIDIFTLNISSHSYLACKVSVENTTDSHMMGLPLHVTSSFSLIAFKIFVFDFWQLEYNGAQRNLLWDNPVWESRASYLNGQIPLMIWEVFSHNFFKFSAHFSLLFLGLP